MATFDWNHLVPAYGLKAAATAGTVLVALLSATAAGGYLVGKDTSQAQIDGLKAALGADLPELTRRFSATDQVLRGSLDVFGKNNILSAENAGLRQRLNDMTTTMVRQDAALKAAQTEFQASLSGAQNDLKAAADRDKQLNDQIAILRGRSRQFKVASNTSEYLIDGHRVGVSAHVDNWTLAVALDNQRYDMAAGNHLPVEAKNKQCNLTLVAMSQYENSGEFDLTCTDLNLKTSSR